MKVLRSLAIFTMATGLAASMYAQATTGNIYGSVSDEQGGKLPGVAVTLSGCGAPRSTTTGSQGDFRIINLPPCTYTVKTELSGFATVERNNVVVNLGTNTELAVSMKIASVATTITVTSETPLIDTRNNTAGSTFNQSQLKDIPTARDPWVVMAQAPGVQMDRVNVAGSESGQQAGIVSRGTAGQNNFEVDGVNLTDMSALGASATYYDFDAFQEMQVVTGGADATTAVPGVTINMVTKRGTNEVHGSARIFQTPNQTQANPPLSINGKPLIGGGNAINHIQDYGIEAGGPLWPDKAWLWGSYGRQQIDLFKLAAGAKTADNTTLENYAGKLNIQPVESNEFTAFYFRGDKLKDGRGTAFSFASTQAAETLWHQSGPTTIWKGDDSQVFGPNLVADASWSYVGTGFSLTPPGTGQMTVTPDGVFRGSYETYSTYRPQHNVNGHLSGFFNTGSIGHELKFGFGYRSIIGGSTSSWPGDQNIVYYSPVTAGNTVKVMRNLKVDEDMKYTNFSLSDTLTAGNLTAYLGIRYDNQKGNNAPTSVPGNATFPAIMPAINYAGGPTEINFKDWQPRVGLTYALGAEKRTLLRASYSRFADELGSGSVAFDNPLGYAYQMFYFSGAGRPTSPAQLGALYTFYGVDPNNPGSISSPNVISSGLSNTKTNEFTVGVDHQILPELVAGLSYTYRHRWDFLSTKLIGVTSADYILNPAFSNLPAYDEFGKLVGHTGNYYSLDPNVVNAITGGRLLYNNGSYSQNYSGLDFQLTKRLTNRWMAHFAGNYNLWKQKQDDVANGCINPTNTRTNTGPGCDDGGLVWQRSLGSGSKGDVLQNSKWSFNISGLYQLPLNFNIAANFFGRQGYLHGYYESVNDGSSALAQTNVIVGNSDNFRYKNVYNLDLRLEKVIPLFQKSDLTLSIDCFNTLNDSTVLQQVSRLRTAPGGHNTGNQVEEVQSPRALRFGARLSF
ncbi:MAG TPA: TonB-dependent receptor [Thermoanaerobaculia bacterium]|nr:TonB-dependent receptor [Thermoanaerobaculia bacterium]